MLPNLFCEDIITLLPKSDKDSKRKKSYKPISHEHRYKNPQRTTRELNPKMYKNNYMPLYILPSGIYSRYVKSVQYSKIN